MRDLSPGQMISSSFYLFAFADAMVISGSLNFFENLEGFTAAAGIHRCGGE